MGYTSAYDMATFAPYDQALTWHLTANHFPPVPASMVEPCRAAIAAALDEEPDRPIDLPDGITYRGLRVAPAQAIIEAHHLEAFIAAAFDNEEEDEST